MIEPNGSRKRGVTTATPYPVNSLIQVDNLRKEFLHEGKIIPVLEGVNLAVNQGEMISIVGASGVGKSTFIQVLGTLDKPTSGKVCFDGNDVFEFTPAELARFRNETIGFVFQFHHLLPEFNALENVMMPALIKRVPRSEAAQLAREVLHKVHLSHRFTHKPGELSGGEQQRVALARALVLRPRLLLADEPTGNLDPATGAGIHELLFKLNEDFNITVMVVTHSLQLARQMPRQLSMVAGKIQEGIPGANPPSGDHTLPPSPSGPQGDSTGSPTPDDSRLPHGDPASFSTSPAGSESTHG